MLKSSFHSNRSKGVVYWFSRNCLHWHLWRKAKNARFVVKIIIRPYVVCFHGLWLTVLLHRPLRGLYRTLNAFLNVKLSNTANRNRHIRENVLNVQKRICSPEVPQRPVLLEHNAYMLHNYVLSLSWTFARKERKLFYKLMMTVSEIYTDFLAWATFNLKAQDDII